MAFNWFRCDEDIVDHPKVKKLQQLLNQPLADAYVLRVMCWVKRYAPSGVVPADRLDALEVAARWPRGRGGLVAALDRAGIADRLPDGSYELHGWAERQGAVVAHAAKNATRQANHRRVTLEAKRYVTPSLGVTRPPTLHNETRHDTTLSTEGGADLPPPGPNGTPAPPPPDQPDAHAAVTNALAAGDFFEQLQVDRARAGLPVEQLDRDLLDKFWGELVAQFGDRARDAAEETARTWSTDPFWKRKNLPFAGLAKQWRDYAPRKQ